MIGDGDDSGGAGKDNIYRGSVEPMLISSFNLYSNEEISVSASGLCSCPILHHPLTTSSTNY